LLKFDLARKIINTKEFVQTISAPEILPTKKPACAGFALLQNQDFTKNKNHPLFSSACWRKRFDF